MEVETGAHVFFMKNEEHYLPSDLWPLILSKLPVKSLLRFRSVSRSWLSLIDDPEFARLHLKSFKNNRNETHLFVVQGKEQQCVVRRSDTFEIDSAVLLTLGQRYCRGGCRVVCCIDGLILIHRVYDEPWRFCDLKVWNPSIRKFLEVPPLHFDEPSRDFYLMDTEIGLGYDPLLNDYKYVKLVFVDSELPTLHSVAIYTLGAASWKIIPFQCKGCSEWVWHANSYNMEAVYFQGSLYFIACDDSLAMNLVSFDLSSEVFSYALCPEESFFRRQPKVVLIDGGSTLAVSNFISSLWVLEKGGSGEDGSFKLTRRCELNLNLTMDFLHVKKNGELVVQWQGRDLLLRDASGKEMRELLDLVMTYNLDTQKETVLLQNIHCIMGIHKVCGYVESLVLLKQGTDSDFLALDG